MNTPSGLKNKTVILNTTTTTRVRKKTTPKDHYLPTWHPPKVPEKNAHFFGGGEGVIDPPLPSVDREKVPVVELLLYDRPKVYQYTTKINKYD